MSSNANAVVVDPVLVEIMKVRDEADTDTSGPVIRERGFRELDANKIQDLAKKDRFVLPPQSSSDVVPSDIDEKDLKEVVRTVSKGDYSKAMQLMRMCGAAFSVRHNQWLSCFVFGDDAVKPARALGTHGVFQCVLWSSASGELYRALSLQFSGFDDLYERSKDHLIIADFDEDFPAAVIKSMRLFPTASLDAGKGLQNLPPTSVIVDSRVALACMKVMEDKEPKWPTSKTLKKIRIIQERLAERNFASRSGIEKNGTVFTREMPEDASALCNHLSADVSSFDATRLMYPHPWLVPGSVDINRIIYAPDEKGAAQGSGDDVEEPVEDDKAIAPIFKKKKTNSDRPPATDEPPKKKAAKNVSSAETATKKSDAKKEEKEDDRDDVNDGGVPARKKSKKTDKGKTDTRVGKDKRELGTHESHSSWGTLLSYAAIDRSSKYWVYLVDRMYATIWKIKEAKKKSLEETQVLFKKSVATSVASNIYGKHKTLAEALSKEEQAAVLAVFNTFLKRSKGDEQIALFDVEARTKATVPVVPETDGRGGHINLLTSGAGEEVARALVDVRQREGLCKTLTSWAKTPLAKVNKISKADEIAEAIEAESEENAEYRMLWKKIFMLFCTVFDIDIDTTEKEEEKEDDDMDISNLL